MADPTSSRNADNDSSQSDKPPQPPAPGAMLEEFRRQDQEIRKQFRQSLAARTSHPAGLGSWNKVLHPLRAILVRVTLGVSLAVTALMWHYSPVIGEREGNIEHLAVLMKTHDSALADEAKTEVVERYQGYSRLSGSVFLGIIGVPTLAAIMRMLTAASRRHQAMRICPACRSRVDPEATICRYCRGPLSPPSSS